MTQWTQFGDSAEHPEKIPFDHAALYADGRFAVAPAVREKFRYWHMITVTGAAWHAGIADYEPGNTVFEEAGRLRHWAADRYNDGMPFRVYTDRDNAAAAVRELVWLAQHALWWIATLDNRQWTPQELADDLAAKWDARIPASRIWGNQFTDQGGEFDVSNLFLGWW